MRIQNNQETLKTDEDYDETYESTTPCGCRFFNDCQECNCYFECSEYLDCD